MEKENIKQKKAIVQEIIEKIKQSKSAVIAHYHGLSVDDLLVLRRKLKSENAEFKVYKNTLVSLAAKSLKFNEIEEFLVGPNALIISNGDEIAGPRILFNFSKKKKALVLKTAIFDGKVINQKTLLEIASLPSKEGLISMFASSLISPIRNFALVVKAIADNK